MCSRHLSFVEAEVHRTPTRLRVLENYYRMEDEREASDLEWVYFIRLGENMVKIGHSTNVTRRFRGITSYTFGEMLALEAGTRALEKRLHRRFNKFAVKGKSGSTEMFALADPIIEYIKYGRKCAAGCRARALPRSVSCVEHQGFRPPAAALVGATAGPPNQAWDPGDLSMQIG